MTELSCAAMRPILAPLLLGAALFAAALPAAAQDVAGGQMLYNSYCRGCHGVPPSGGPDRGAANNPTFIRATINGQTQMRFLSFLTNAELADIAAYIGVALGGAPPTPVPTTDYTDLWYDPAESGWGFSLVQHASHQMFGVIYTYEAPNRPLWLVMPGGTWLTAQTFRGDLYRVTGPPQTGAFNPALTKAQPVGTATVSFSSVLGGTLAYTVNGAAVTKTLRRQPF